jgi:hypothetical protein
LSNLSAGGAAAASAPPSTMPTADPLTTNNAAGQPNRCWSTNSTQTTLAPANQRTSTMAATSSIITATVNNQPSQQQAARHGSLGETDDSTKLARERLYVAAATTAGALSVSAQSPTVATTSSGSLTCESSSSLNDYLLYESNLNQTRRDENATSNQAAKPTFAAPSSLTLVSNFSSCSEEDEI